MPKTLIYSGLLLILIGLVWYLVERLGLGRLPGDIHIKGDHFNFHFPIMTSLIISAVLSLILYLVHRFRN